VYQKPLIVTAVVMLEFLSVWKIRWVGWLVVKSLALYFEKYMLVKNLVVSTSLI
jgi:hypothetical protein